MAVAIRAWQVQDCQRAPRRRLAHYVVSSFHAAEVLEQAQLEFGMPWAPGCHPLGGFRPSYAAMHVSPHVLLLLFGILCPKTFWSCYRGLIITYTILGAPYYSYGIVAPILAV